MIHKLYIALVILFCLFYHNISAQNTTKVDISKLDELYEQHKYAQTIALGLSLVNELDTNLNSTELEKMYLLMSKSAQSIHQDKDALTYLKQSQHFKKKAIEQEKNATIKKFENNQELQEKNNAVKRLEREAEIKAEQLESQKLQLTGLIVGVIVLCILSFVLYQTLKQKAKLQKRLKRQNDEIAAHRQEILKKQADLTKINQNKNQLFTTISKDIRTPIDELKSILNVFKEQNLPPEKIVELAPQLLDNVDDVAETVDNLLKWSLKEMKGNTTTSVKFDFIDVANEVLSGMDNIALHNKIKLLDKIDPHLKIIADRNQILTILRNLLSFSLKNTPEGGTVELTAHIENDKARIRLIDTAPTLSKQEIAELFSVSINSEQPASSASIAMALCKTFLENHESKLYFFRNQNGGNIYQFDLPLAP